MFRTDGGRSNAYVPPADPAAIAAEYHAQQSALAAAAAAASGPGNGERRAGAHRATRSPLRYVLPALVGALVLVAVGIGIAGWLGGTGGNQVAPGPISSHIPFPTVGSSHPSSTSASGPATTSASPSASPTHPTHPATPAATSAAPLPPVVHAPVVVLNETTQTGFAARVAEHLRTMGWTVTGVGNWRGEIGTTTVYYPPSLLAAARSLARDLGVGRLRPRVPGMVSDRLTVVLTRDP